MELVSAHDHVADGRHWGEYAAVDDEYAHGVRGGASLREQVVNGREDDQLCFSTGFHQASVHGDVVDSGGQVRLVADATAFQQTRHELDAATVQERCQVHMLDEGGNRDAAVGTTLKASIVDEVCGTGTQLHGQEYGGHGGGKKTHQEEVVGVWEIVKPAQERHGKTQLCRVVDDGACKQQDNNA